MTPHPSKPEADRREMLQKKVRHMAHNYGKAYEGESGLLFPAEEHETAFTSQLMSLIDTYTAQQSLIRAKEELEKLKQYNGAYIGIDGKRVDNMVHHTVIDEAVKRLDAEGGEQ
jgi:ribosomal protein L4